VPAYPQSVPIPPPRRALGVLIAGLALLLVSGCTTTAAQTAFRAFPHSPYADIPTLLAEISHGTTLEPGDIIATGTPAGVGFARTPPEFLRPGDVMESVIEGIGALRNRIVAVE